jgi:hypothetical protein
LLAGSSETIPKPGLFELKSSEKTSAALDSAPHNIAAIAAKNIFAIFIEAFLYKCKQKTTKLSFHRDWQVGNCQVVTSFF